MAGVDHLITIWHVSCGHGVANRLVARASHLHPPEGDDSHEEGHPVRRCGDVRLFLRPDLLLRRGAARQGDGLSYDPAFEDPLHAGAEFHVLEERPGWHRVELPDGRRCWLADRDVELVR